MEPLSTYLRLSFWRNLRRFEAGLISETSKCGMPWDNVGVQSPFAFIDAALLPSESLTEIIVPGDCPLSKAYIRSQPSFRHSLQHSQSIFNENNRFIHLFFK